MAQFVLTTADGKQWFSGIFRTGGQPGAVGTEMPKHIRFFPSRKAAENYRAKWLGTGAGMERFKLISEYEVPG